MNSSTDNKRLVAGVDIGGTHVTCVLMDSSGTVLQKEVTPVTDRSVDAVVDVIARGLNIILADVDSIHCIGVGVPGNVDPVARTARYLPNFGWPMNVPLGQLISSKLIVQHQSAHILMRNDGRCAALAESHYGAGREAKVFSMLTIGTGIGGALVINNTLFDGFSFDAGDFGHALIRSDSDASTAIVANGGVSRLKPVPMDWLNSIKNNTRLQTIWTILQLPMHKIYCIWFVLVIV